MEVIFDLGCYSGIIIESFFMLIPIKVYYVAHFLIDDVSYCI